jgi:DMSO/TMAO reductase YedYZ molybdopterin-dependent catalytic subunit
VSPEDAGPALDADAPVSGNAAGHRHAIDRLRSATAEPPPGPFRARWWKSPVRGPWLTSFFGSILLVGIPVEFLTGLVSYASYDPRLVGNDTTPGKGILGFYLFNWITSPSWLYRVSQGTHIVLGLTLVPIVLAKLWSVIPKLFEWPGLRSVAHGLERLSLALIVGGAVFEFATGIADIEYYYPWKFDFYQAHLYGAWVFIVGFVVHVSLKLPTMWRSLKRYSLREVLRTPLARTRPETGDGHGLVASRPSSPTISRRGILGLVGASSAAVFLLTAGGTVRSLRPLALLSPRARSQGTGPHPEANDFEVNRVFASTGIPVSATGDSWRLVLSGPRSVALSRAELMAMPLATEVLPIACVEGWSTVQTWTGVRLVDLARLAGVDDAVDVTVESLEKPGQPFRSATLASNQAGDSQTLLALCVNGEDISLDHGYPARMIVPAAPGVHCTKWVSELRFLT